MRYAIGFAAVLGTLLACGGAVAPLSDGPGGGWDSGAPVQSLAPRAFGCTRDVDCLAVRAGGCCPDGSKVAVNIDEIGNYENATKCAAKDPPPCAPPRADDTRVALCMWTSSQPSVANCEMIAIADIPCGGFVGNPHACPRGLICEEPGNDGPGTCVQPRLDCRSTGCNEADTYCAECAGTFTCRSVHSGC